jgi:glycosyltransferase involved in cell wall biosynthesis
MPGTDAPPRRLLFIAPDAAFFVSHRLNLAIGALRQGYPVAVACPPGPAVANIIDAGAEHISFAITRRSTNAVRELGTILAMGRAIRGFGPDLVHLITSKPILYGGAWCRLFGIPSVSAVSGLGYLFVTRSLHARILRRLVKAGYKFALNGPKSHVIFQNKDDLALFRSSGIVTHDRAHLIAGSGTDLSIFPQTQLPPGRTVVALPARMIGDKGVMEFIQAARILRSSGVDAVFRLIGDPDPGNPTTLTEAQLRHYVDEGAVEWQPHTADIAGALAQAHIVALPSYREGFPKTLIDAAAAGRASVTTDVPGCRDAIIEGETGLLCTARDGVDLARVLRRLIEDRGLQQRMGAAARRHAETSFDISSVTADHLELYEAAIRSAGGTNTAP